MAINWYVYVPEQRKKYFKELLFTNQLEGKENSKSNQNFKLVNSKLYKLDP